MEVIDIIRIYDKDSSVEWNNIVKSFNNWDVYYLGEYAVPLMLHGDGEPYLIYYNDGTDRFCYVVMQKDIANDIRFANQLEKGKLYDWETPYGYGGPLSDSPITEYGTARFQKELAEYCDSRGVISQFARFHPLLENYGLLPALFEKSYMWDTVYIETKNPQQIMADMDSKNRNMIRKAAKNGISIRRCDISDIEAFIPMYEGTMNRNAATEYYDFAADYYESLKQMRDNACIFYAFFEGRAISASIMLYNERFMHYHLSGSDADYRSLSPNNLLLYEAACWASGQGIERFHLGGGMAPDDSLFGFKKQFSKNGRSKFMIGRTIFNETAYRRLLDIRRHVDSSFDMDNGHLIQYRG